MAKESEYGTKTRLLRIMRTIVDRPYAYTKKQLAREYNVHEDTIKGDFEAFRNGGFEMDIDRKGRYAFIVDKPLKKLEELLYFTDQERILLHQAIDSLEASPEQLDRLKRKLHALYDFSKLGHEYLRKPYLSKVDILEEAKKNKKLVTLVNYRSSNSNSVVDRTVEPFHIDVADDTLQAFDPDRQGIRHFRISRISRVKLNEETWSFEGHHKILRTDPFRIVDNNQINVHLRLSVGASNELTSKYPITKTYIMETGDPDIFDFQCSVNERFLGLSNFILGYFNLGIEVVSPDSLRDILNNAISKAKF
jgi:predicted DNA-binding transcriptional regulator YafY